MSKEVGAGGRLDIFLDSVLESKESLRYSVESLESVLIVIQSGISDHKDFLPKKANYYLSLSNSCEQNRNLTTLED